MYETVAEIQREEDKYFYRDNGHGMVEYSPPTEFDQKLNNLTRRKISCFLQEKGRAWLGEINQQYGGEIKEPILHQYKGGVVLTFTADFIVPEFDNELIQLIKLWRNKANIETLNAINDRISKIDGTLLCWV